MARDPLFIETVGQLRDFLEGFPYDHKLSFFDMEKAEFVIIVDSNGNAQRVTNNKMRTLLFSIEIPIAS